MSLKDERLNRVENKLDVLKDEVSTIKVEQKVGFNNLEQKMSNFEKEVAKHVAGDDKIIKHIQPLLQELPAIIEITKEFEYQKKLKEDRKSKLKWITLIGSALGVLATFLTYFSTLVRNIF